LFFPRIRPLVAAGVLLLGGCGPHAPELLPPDRTESFCIDKEPRGTAVASILSSVADRPLTNRYPGDAAVRTDVKKYGGIIGHWKSQPLYLPATAAMLGVTGDYIDVREVAIDNQLEDAESRVIYVTVAAPKGPAQLVLRAYDVQNVCVEGTRLS
jgi:hypothetical protein